MTGYAQLADQIEEAEAVLESAEQRLEDAEDAVSAAREELDKLRKASADLAPTEADIIAACHADSRQIAMPLIFRAKERVFKGKQP